MNSSWPGSFRRDPHWFDVTVRALRRGSIAASRVVAAAGGPSGAGNVEFLDLPGTSGNYVSTPDSAAVSITSDIDVRIKVAMADWTPAALVGLVAKYGSSGTRSYRLYVNADGTVQFDISSGGASAISAISTAATGFTDGTTHWVRATWNNTTDTCKFYTSSDGNSWSQLGADVAQAASAIFDGNAPLVLGALNSGAANWLDGSIYYFELRSGIDGTVVAKFDATDVTRTAVRTPTTWVAPTTETWTVNGTGWDWDLE